MPIKTDVDHARKLIHFELDGTLDTKEMLSAVDDAFAQVDGKGAYDFLSDNRKLTTPATPEQIKTLIARLTREGATVNGIRCAVIVSQEASYGMMRLFAAHAEPLGIQVGIFWNMKDARAFLA